MGRWTSMRQLFWCSLVMDVETLNPDPFPPADTTSNVPTSGRRGLEFARSADHRKSWVQSISFTVNSFFYVFSLLQSADLVDSPPFLRHSETWCLSDVILQSSSLIGSTQECPKRLKVKADLNNSKIVVNLFGVFYTTQIVQIVHGHVFERGVTLRRTLGWRFAELIGMIFRAKNGRAIPHAAVVVVVVLAVYWINVYMVVSDVWPSHCWALIFYAQSKGAIVCCPRQ